MLHENQVQHRYPFLFAPFGHVGGAVLGILAASSVLSYRRKGSIMNNFENTQTAYYDLTAAGARIRALRRERGYTQEQLAELIGVDRGFLCKVERGQRGFSIDVLVILRGIFGVSLEYLILGIRNEPVEDSEAKLQRMLTQLDDMREEISGMLSAARG